MTGERSVSTCSFPSFLSPIPAPLFSFPSLIFNIDRGEATWFGRNDLDLRIWTLFCEAGVWCEGMYLEDVGPQRMYNTEYLDRQTSQL